MCGIVGYVGPRDALPLLMSGLRRLEYRGYDSAGVALEQDGGLEVRRAEGKLENLAAVVAARPARGHTGIGTPVGRRTAGRPRRMPTRTSTAVPRPRSSTTGSSRTSKP